MNKLVSESELLSSVAVMTRRDKLLRWAQVVRSNTTSTYFSLYHGLENCTREQLNNVALDVTQTTAFAAALRDPILQDGGVSEVKTLGGMIDFMEIDQTQLHEFSCDCGGSIGNEDMAKRIEHIAG